MLGDILITRLMVRGVAAFVTDGPMRDAAAVAAIAFPTFCTGSAAPASLAAHFAAAVQDPISCGGVAVFPGDVLVGDPDGVCVIPRNMADDVARDAGEQELMEEFILRGIPAWIRSDNGPEFVAEAVRRWIAAVGARTAFIEPGSPWENGYIESFNARLRDELLNGEIFYTLKEAQVLIESWRCHYNAIRPHGSLGYRPPAPETVVLPSWLPGSATLRRPPSLAGKPAMH